MSRNPPSSLAASQDDREPFPQAARFLPDWSSCLFCCLLFLPCHSLCPRRASWLPPAITLSWVRLLFVRARSSAPRSRRMAPRSTLAALRGLIPETEPSHARQMSRRGDLARVASQKVASRWRRAHGRSGCQPRRGVGRMAARPACAVLGRAMRRPRRWTSAPRALSWGVVSAAGAETAEAGPTGGGRIQ